MTKIRRSSRSEAGPASELALPHYMIIHPQEMSIYVLIPICLRIHEILAKTPNYNVYKQIIRYVLSHETFVMELS
jgi:hypothetical protein